MTKEILSWGEILWGQEYKPQVELVRKEVEGLDENFFFLLRRDAGPRRILSARTCPFLRLGPVPVSGKSWAGWHFKAGPGRPPRAEVARSWGVAAT